jgi:DNA polymerase III subunit beta
MLQTDLEDAEYLGRAKQPRDTTKPLTLHAGALAAAMTRCSAAIGRGGTLPILTSVLLRTSGGKMTVEASNLELAIRQEIAVEGGDSHAGCVNAATLSSVASKLSADAEVTLEFTSGSLVLRSGRSRVTLTLLPPDDYPAFGGGHFACRFEVPCAEMQTALERTRPFMADNEKRQFLCGVHVMATDVGLRFAATNANDLAITTVPVTAPGMPEIIIPAPTVTELTKLAAGIGVMTVSVSETKIMCEMPGVTMISKLIDGVYPQTERIVPRDNNCLLNVRTNEMARALILTSIVSDGPTPWVRIAASATGVRLSSGSGVDEVICDLEDGSFRYDGDDFTAAFWNRSLMEPTKLCGKSIEFQFRNDTPFIATDPDDPTASYIAMSIRK